jgi:hypothetical protein
LSETDGRPEKEQAKQVQALAILFKDHPEYRSGDKRITLTMMGGTRNAEDKERAEGLRNLAIELGVSVSPMSCRADDRIMWNYWRMRHTRKLLEGWGKLVLD